MVPLKLSLRNFLSYGETETTLDFRDFSIACLCGKNGHGKSALIDAITWAIWGKCRVKNNEEVIRRGASGGYVELEFESDGNVYRIIRSIRKTKRTSPRTLDIQIYDESTGSFKPLDQQGKAQNTIGSILKMDYNSFICSSFILQGMADEFTKRTPAERKEILSKVLELDEYEVLTKKAREHLQSGTNELSILTRENEQLSEEISKKKYLDKKLKASESELGNVSKNIEELEKISAGLISDNESIKAKMETLNTKAAEKSGTETKLNNIRDELGTLENLIAKDQRILSEKDKIINRYRQYEKALEIDKEFTQKQIAKSNLEKDLERINSMIASEKAKIESTISSLDTKLKEKENIIHKAREILARREVIESGYLRLTEAISLEKSAEDKKQSIDKIEHQIKEIRNKIEQSKIKLETIAKEIRSKAPVLKQKAKLTQKLTTETEYLNEKLKQLRLSEKKLEKLNEEIKELDKQKQTLLTEQKELKLRKTEETNKLSILNSERKEPHCPLCESPLQEQAKAALQEKLKRNIAELDTKFAEQNKTYAWLGETHRDLLKQAKVVATETSKLNAVNKQLGEKEQLLKEAINSSAELEKLKEEITQIENDISSGNYAQEYKKELTLLVERKCEVNYNSENHVNLKKEIENLRKFETEIELLKRDTHNHAEAEKEVASIRLKLEPLIQKLEQNNYEGKNRTKIIEIQKQLADLGYDKREHGKFKKNLEELKTYSAKKEELDKAAINLEHREKQKQKLILESREETKKLKLITKELTGLEDIRSKSKKIREQLTASQSRTRTLIGNKDQLLGDISRSKNEIERIETFKENKKTKEKSINRIKGEIGIYQELVKAFGKNGLQALIIEQAVPEIETEANNILSKLTEGTMTLSLEMVKPTQTGGAKETLEIYIGDSSGTRSYETFSGGESFRIDFALRVGISKFIANRSGAQLRTLVIDEGFGTQDKDGLNQFIQVLNTIKGDFDKILAITHVDELKERFPVRIEVSKEPGLGSSLEVIYS